MNDSTRASKELSFLQGAHPRGSNDKRSELELCLRDAFAAGCEASSQRSLFTAMDYAKREAPIVAERIRASHEPPAGQWWCDTCHCIVEPVHVTNDETHDLRAGGCGQHVFVRAAQPPSDDEPSVMGGAVHPIPPPPTGVDRIEWHVREIQKICDALNLDPVQWLMPALENDVPEGPSPTKPEEHPWCGDRPDLGTSQGEPDAR